MVEQITEPQRDLPINLTCDILVAGGGIAGVSAAIAAARHGKKVVLVEREYGLGGMATLGLIAIYLPLDDGRGTQVSFGIAEELLRLSIEQGAPWSYPAAWLDEGSEEDRKKCRFVVQFNPNLFSLSIERLLVDLGVTILYGSMVCSLCMDASNTSINAAIIENKSGRSAIKATSFIDCTGDADLCSMAGESTFLHKAGNGLASWYFYQNREKTDLKMFGLADIANRDDDSDSNEKRDSNEYDNVKVDSLDRNFRFSGIDGYELSESVIVAHGKMFDDILAQRKIDSEYWPVQISSIPLVRMSRRLVGATTLSASSDHVKLSDSIGMIADWRKNGPVFDIGFGALHGVKVHNLLTAGRTISSDEDMWDITRVIPPCAVSGQAAGTAAALSDDFIDLDVSTLQNVLAADGAKLHL